MINKRPGFRKRIALEFFRSLRKNRAKLHEFHTLYWECTSRCNSTGCAQARSNTPSSDDRQDMPLADFLKVIDDITPHVEPNQVQVIFTGGEPLLRNDLEHCGTELVRRGFRWGIESDGLLLTPERLEALIAAGMQTVTLSLDGFEEAHNWLHCHPKGFEGAVNAICLLAEKPEVTCEVTTRVYPKNLKDFPLFKDFLIEMGATRWQLSALFPKNTADAKELRLTNAHFTWLLNFIRYCRQEGKIHTSYGSEGFLGNYEAEVRDSLFHCQVGITAASIRADGSIAGGPDTPACFHQGNIYKDSFSEVWEQRFDLYRNRKWTRKGICAKCNMYRYCEGNDLHLYDENGNLSVCHYQHII